MSDPIAERLSRLTPDAGALDRDALLFAAGRASARASRRWQVATVVLAACQVGTLILLWPHAAPPSGPLPIVEETPPATAPADWGVTRTIVASEDEWKRPPDSGPLIPDEPPLRAFSAPPNDLFN